MMAVTPTTGDMSSKQCVSKSKRNGRRCLSLNLTFRHSPCPDGPRSAGIQGSLSFMRHINMHSSLKRKESSGIDDDLGIPYKRQTSSNIPNSCNEETLANTTNRKYSEDGIHVTPSEMAELLTADEKCPANQQECPRLPIVVDFRGMDKESQIRSAIRVPCETRIKLRLLLPRLDKLLAAMCSHQCEFKHGDGDRLIIICSESDAGRAGSHIVNNMITHIRETHSRNVRIFKSFPEFNKSYPYLCELAASSFRTLSVFLDCSAELDRSADIKAHKSNFPSIVDTSDQPFGTVSANSSGTNHLADLGQTMPNVTPMMPLEYFNQDYQKDVYRAPVSMILPFLYLGNEIDSTSEQLLTSHRIRSVLNLTKEAPFLDETRFNCRRLPASDVHLQDMRQLFAVAFQFIEAARCSGDAVLVHCQAGVSRSPTLVIAYLMAHSSLSFGEAYHLVKSRRPVVSPNFSFLGQLSEFESDLLSGRVVRQPDTLRDLITTMSDHGRERQPTVLSSVRVEEDRPEEAGACY